MRKLGLSVSFFVILIVCGCSFQDVTTMTTPTTQTSALADTATYDLAIHYLDVGQADSIYIKLPDGENMLIDAGNNPDGPFVVNYLQNQGVAKLDYVVGTHPHEDHIGGLDNVINAFNIGKVYLPDITQTTTTYTDVIAAINARHLTVTQAKSGVVLFNTSYEGKTLKAVMLAPIDDTYTEINNYSAVIKLTYGFTSYLFVGDAQKDVEDEMIQSGVDLHADVLKVGHHGSDTSTSQEFLNAVQPKIGVISVGADNDYGHPNQVTLDRLIASHVTIYRTDEDGTIVVKSNGKDILVSTEKSGGGIIPVQTTTTISATTAASVTGTLLINEVLPAPHTAFTAEFVEIYNTTSASIDLSGYQIDDIANGGAAPKTIPDGTVIAPHGFYVFTCTNVFNNSGDDVRLISPSGALVDSFTYGDTGYDASWYRTPDGGYWADDPSNTPTPGASNSDN